MNDVETILSEIRERVRDEEQQRGMLAPQTGGHERNGSERSLPEKPNQTIERLHAHLTTTARAWERLPPVHSDRSGGSARLERWIKARFKALSRWFTWEQINFNAATHHALSDAAELLTAQQRELTDLRNHFEEQQQAFETSGSEFEAKVQRVVEEMRARMTQVESKITDVSARVAQVESRISDDEIRKALTEVDSRITELRAEYNVSQSRIDAGLAELASDLREEQRVCFRQLSLEVSEAAVLEDRGRRAIEARLERLEESDNKAPSDSR